MNDIKKHYYAVLENDHPAVSLDNERWSKYTYDTFEEAVAYAIDYAGDLAFVLDGIKPNRKMDISSYGDYIEIKEVNN